jgi:hypothetical protein
MIEDQGMDILDISNPASPTYLGSFQTAYSPWAIEAVGSIVYLADVQFAGYTTWLRAIDVSDSHNPTEVGVYHPASPGDYMVVTDLKFESNLLYMATYISQGTLLVLDVSNPSDPVLAGYDDRWSVAYALDAHKQIIYQAEIMGVTILRYTGSIPQNQFDLTVQSALPLQVLEYFDLVEDKPTAVKAVVCKSGSESVQHVPMQVKVGTTVISEFYVADKANTDENTGVLKSNNSAYPLNFGAGYGCKIVYFFGDRLTPTGNSFAVEVEVNPGGTIHELDRTNNTAVSDTLQVKKMSWGVLDPNLSFYYFRTDWAVNPNRTYENFYAEANSFIQAVYPVAPGQYHPVSLAGTRGDTSGSRGGDNHLSNIELNVWLMRTAVDMRLANPLADRYVAVVPEGWFAANTDYLTTPGIRNLMAGDLVLVEAGSSTRPNGTAYSTPAHEIGHSYGLPTGLPPFCGGEEYLDECHPGQISDGNPSGIGIWPGRRIPIGIADLPSFCFMSASELESYWVDPLDYAKLFNDHRSILSGQGPVSHTASPVLLASGTIHQNGVASLENWYTLPEGELTPLKPGPYTFEYQDSEGNVLHQVDFAIEFNMERAELDETGFVITLPLIPGTDKIQLKYNSLSVAQKTISANPPEVSITSPNDPGPFTQQMLVEWNGIDQDGDELTYTLLFSPDDGVTWEVIAGNMAATSSLWDLSGLAGGSQYLLKVIATDGFHSTQMVSESFSILQALHLPLILR